MNTLIQDNMDKAPRNARFYVRPRYSGGSPAMVDEHIARQVAHDEVQAIERWLEGVCGDVAKEFATTEGLTNIVYARWEKGRKVMHLDVITGAVFIEPKRLDHHDETRLRLLLRQRKYLTLSRSEQDELSTLELAAKIHRQAGY